MDKNKAAEKIDAVVGRAIRDENFRKKLAEDPKATLEEEGLTDDDLDSVAGGVTLATASTPKLNTFYSNLTNVFRNPSNLKDVTIAAWSTDKACNERG